jgi:hypothetical protein
VIKRIAPVGLILAIACGGGGDGTGPSPVSADISTMAVGEVRVLSPSDLTNGINLPTTSSARDYVIIVGNTSSQHDVVAKYVVRADKSTGSFGISAPSDLGAQSNVLVGEIPLARTPQQALDNRIRAYERKNLVLRSASDPLGVSRFSLRRSVTTAALAVPAVGDRINLKVPDGSFDTLCNHYFNTQAVVASVSNKAILAVDTLDGPPSGLFTQMQLDSITTEFDNYTYPTDASYFNTPTDVDNNAGHIIILFTGQINKLTPRGSTGGITGGFFFSGDFFPTTNQGGGPGSFCAESNEAEIFYVLAPDPTAKFGDARTSGFVRQLTRGTIAHEFQHMINAGNRYQNPAAKSFEASWLDEGLSHFAEDAVGRAVVGMGDLATFTSSNFATCNTPCTAANDFNAFFYQNLARLVYWMARPDTSSGITADTLIQANLSSRGAAWALVRYAADDYSNGLPRSLTHSLSVGPDTGVKNLSAAAGAPIDTLVAGWLVSMYADHLGIAGLDAKYQYRSYNFRSVMPTIARSLLNQTTAAYPLAVQPIGSGSDNITATNRSGTGTYYNLSVPANSGTKTVKILDQSGNPASFSGEHVYVLRVQ